MFEWIEDLRHDAQIAKHERTKRKISKGYAKDVRAAKKAKKHYQEIQALEANERFELEPWEDEIDNLRTKFYRARARKYQVSIPDIDEHLGYWERRTNSHPWTLTAKGVSYVRSAIREEKKAQSDVLIRWVPFVSGITGLVGAASGLVALLSK